MFRSAPCDSTYSEFLTRVLSQDLGKMAHGNPCLPHDILCPKCEGVAEGRHASWIPGKCIV